MGHSLSENRNGLILGISVTEANGTAESEAAIDLIDRYRERHCGSPKTLGADKGYDNGPLLIKLEQRGIEPHIAMTSNAPADPERVRADRQANNAARHRMQEHLKSVEYQVSQRVRKKVEEGFGWLKTIDRLGRSRWVGPPKKEQRKLRQQMELSAAAYNLIRMHKLKPI